MALTFASVFIDWMRQASHRKFIQYRTRLQSNTTLTFLIEGSFLWNSAYSLPYQKWIWRIWWGQQWNPYMGWVEIKIRINLEFDPSKKGWFPPKSDPCYENGLFCKYIFDSICIFFFFKITANKKWGLMHFVFLSVLGKHG